MITQSYQPDEVHFAYCYRIYARFRADRAKPFPQLAKIDTKLLNEIMNPYDIRVLECASNSTDLLVELSLQPTESISASLSKLKGRVSKWLTEESDQGHPSLRTGYFACTVGKSTRDAVESYLDGQATHHGYANRAIPPVYVRTFEITDEDQLRIAPRHAYVVSQFHFVLATHFRHGVFGSHSGPLVAEKWLRHQNEMRIALLKVSFVPDHVHIALRAHPSVSPAEAACTLMNSAQEVMHPELISDGVDQLWQPSAYLGAFGDLASPQVRKYIGNWENSLGKAAK